MSLNIKDPEAHQLAQAISRATGESMTRVVKEALRERYARIERRKGRASVEELLLWSGEIGSDISVFFSNGAAYCTGR